MLAGEMRITNLCSTEVSIRHQSVDKGGLPHPTITTKQSNLIFQTQGDISPTIVAQGMKVALITTIFGIIVALVLQLFYSYILSKIEHLTAQMEESAIRLLDLMALWKQNH